MTGGPRLLGRIATAEGPRWVRPHGDRLIPVADPFAAFAAGHRPADVGEAVDAPLIAPVDPTVLVGIAQNGPEHVSPVQAWLKSPRTVVVGGAEVTLRRDAGAAVAEGEIAVVIGRATAGLTAGNAQEFVLGVTAVNDLSSPERVEFRSPQLRVEVGGGVHAARAVDRHGGRDRRRGALRGGGRPPRRRDGEPESARPDPGVPRLRGAVDAPGTGRRRDDGRAAFAGARPPGADRHDHGRGDRPGHPVRMTARTARDGGRVDVRDIIGPEV